MLLTLESLSKFLSTILAKSDCLIAAGCLNVIFTEHEFGLLQVMLIGLKGCVHLVNFLVHEAKFQIDGGDLRVMLAYTCLENVESPVQILEAF